MNLVVDVGYEVDHQSCAWSVAERLCCLQYGVISRSDDTWGGGMWPTGVTSVGVQCQMVLELCAQEEGPEMDLVA